MIEYVENRLLSQGFTEVVLETCTDWVGVVSFYIENGFEITHQEGEDTYFKKTLRA